MAFHLKKSRNLPLTNSTQLPKIFAGYGGLFVGATELHGQIKALRGRRIQRKQVDDSCLPLHFLFNAFAHSSIHRAHCQIPFVLPHSSSVSTLQKGLPLGRHHNPMLCLNPESSLHCLIKSRHLCKDIDSMRYDSGVESDGENESFVVDNAKIEIDQDELQRVCKVIDETFAIDRNMEAVLDECVINLSQDLVLCVLQRFNHARKPAFRFFRWASESPGFAHDSRTYNAMMDILGKTRQFETMVSVLEEMGEKGLLTLDTFTICIKAFASAKERKKAVGIFDLMKKYKFRVGVETINCLLDALGRAKLAKEAQVLFAKMEQKFTPNLSTYTILLNGWCEVKNLMEAGRIWNRMIDDGFKPDIVAHCAMLGGLLRSQKRSDAIKLFEVMRSKGPSPNARSYTILIRYLCKHGHMNEAIEYFYDMLDSRCEVDVALYTCLMTGFANQKKMDMVYRLIKEMKEKGCAPDGRMYNALIKMMVNRQMPDDAVKIYKRMTGHGIQPTVHTYNMIMKSYFVARNCEMGYAVWEEMKKKGCCPDENTYTVLIGGLLRHRRSNEVYKYLEEMIDKGMKAPRFDYDKLTGGFSRTGRGHISEDGNFRKSEVDNVYARWMR